VRAATIEMQTLIVAAFQWLQTSISITTIGAITIGTGRDWSSNF